MAVANQLGFKKIYEAPVEVNLDFSESSIKGLFTNNGIWNFVVDTLAVWYRMNILNYYRDGKNRVKVYDNDLGLYINTGEIKGGGKKKLFYDLVTALSKKISFHRTP